MELKEVLLDLINSAIQLNTQEETEQLVSEYLDYIADKANEQKWINNQIETTIREYPIDGSMQEKVDFYVQLKDKKSMLEAKIKSMQEVLKNIDDELIVFLEQNPTDRLTSSDGYTVSPTTRVMFSSTQSDVKLVKETLKDQWEEFEGFNTKRMNALIKDYKGVSEKLGVPLEDVLPKGIVVSKNTYLTVRKPSKKGNVRESEFDIMSLINSTEGAE